MAHDNSFDSDGGRESSGTINRRRFIEVTGAGAVATVMAGCGDGGGDSGDDGSGDGDTGNGQTTSQNTPEPPEGPIRIGHLAPEGDNPLGLGSAFASQMAVDQLNDDGGIADQEVELIRGNTQGLPSEGQSVAEEMITQDDVDVLVGTFVSEVSQTVLPLAAENDVPFIVSGSAAPSTITDFVGQNYDQFRNLFRTGPVNTTFQAEAMSQYVDYLNEAHGWNTFAFVADQATWTDPFNNILPGLLQDKDYSVPLQTRIPTSTTEFQSVMDNVLDNGADAMLRFFAHIEAGQMAGLWHQAAPRYDYGIEGIHVSAMHPAYYELTQEAATFETTSQSGAAGVTPITENTQPFVQDYQTYVQENGTEGVPSLPMYMGFNTFDAINVYGNAVERAGTADFANYADEFVDAMLQTDHVGVAGTVNFYGEDAEFPHDVQETRDQDGRITNFPVTQWHPGGSIECVYPEVHRTADHLAPQWMQ